MSVPALNVEGPSDSLGGTWRAFPTSRVRLWRTPTGGIHLDTEATAGSLPPFRPSPFLTHTSSTTFPMLSPLWR